jgi:hypothetical protein
VGVCKRYDSMGVREMKAGGGIRATGKIESSERAHSLGRHEKKVPIEQNHYSILVTYVKDYYKWFVCRGIGKRVPKWHRGLRKKSKTRTLKTRGVRHSATRPSGLVNH